MEYFNISKMKTIGERIQAIRKKKSLTQTKLAEELGISIKQLSNIESGRCVCKPDYIYLLVQILGTSPDYLFFGNGVEKVKESTDEKIMTLLSGVDEGDKEKIYQIISIIMEKRAI